MSDLDKEELEVTRNIGKTADEMLINMKYEIIVETNQKIQYEFTGLYFDREIIFDLTDKSILCELSTGESMSMTMQELQAINQKCKELRMDK